MNLFVHFYIIKMNFFVHFYIVILYVSAISEKFKITEDLNVGLSYSNFHKLKNFIKTHKDILPISSKKNIMYKISCKDLQRILYGTNET